VGFSPPTRQGKASSSFLKKRTKKLLSVWFAGAPAVVPTQATDKSFLLLFFKKEVLALSFFCFQQPPQHRKRLDFEL
jgi:hypothetical protein